MRPASACSRAVLDKASGGAPLTPTRFYGCRAYRCPWTLLAMQYPGGQRFGGRGVVLTCMAAREGCAVYSKTSCQAKIEKVIHELV